MPLDAQDLLYLDAKFDGLTQATALLIAPLTGRITELELKVEGDGNGRKGLIRLLDAFKTAFETHTHEGMVRIRRRDILFVLSAAGALAGIVAAVVSVWPRA